MKDLSCTNKVKNKGTLHWTIFKYEQNLTLIKLTEYHIPKTDLGLLVLLNIYDEKLTQNKHKVGISLESDFYFIAKLNSSDDIPQ